LPFCGSFNAGAIRYFFEGHLHWVSAVRAVDVPGRCAHRCIPGNCDLSSQAAILKGRAMAVMLTGTIIAIAMIAIASFVFWRIGQEGGIGRWQKVPAIDALIVLIVYGGWVGGAGILVSLLLKATSN
jgi:hypothetical protein